ncbi:MAG: DUF4293 family protein [Chlorobium sp.]|nr:MAG: DUF4293 family protein [Chlorobium sp.]
MVARIQNLYLLLAGLLAIASIFLPFWSFNTGHLFLICDFVSSETAEVQYSIGSYASGIFSVVTALASFTAIFFFKNRALQSKLILLAIVLFALDLLSGLTAAHFLNQYFESLHKAVTHNPEAGMYILLPEPVLLWLALKGVKKDDKIANAYKRL